MPPGCLYPRGQAGEAATRAGTSTSLLQRRGRSRHGIGRGAAATTIARAVAQISCAKRRQVFRNASSPSKRQGGCYLSDGGYPTHGAATERAPGGARRGDGASAASGRCGRPGSDVSRRATERSDGASVGVAMSKASSLRRGQRPQERSGCGEADAVDRHGGNVCD